MKSSHSWLDFILNLSLISICVGHSIYSPYSKVEESFNLQAIHDHLAFGFHKRDLQKYDHIQFPGAVPRSFIASIALSIISYPFLLLAKTLDLIQDSSQIQIIIRCLLSSFFAISIIYLSYNLLSTTCESTDKSNHPQRILNSRRCFIILSSLQFHLPFWSGRTTPNGMVLPLVIYALSNLFTSKPQSLKTSASFLKGISILVACATIMRLELIGLIIPASLWGLMSNRTKFVPLILTGFISGLSSMTMTILIDSYFWQRNLLKDLLWPELHAIIYNVIEGKSSDWGVSPPLAYFTSHLPKLLNSSISFLPIGALILTLQKSNSTSFISSNSFGMLFVSFSHIGLLSLLGHKEWRFIVYVVPLLNSISAVGISSSLDFASPSALRRRSRLLLLRLASLSLVLISLGLLTASTLISTIASHGNYPGGDALRRLHQILDKDEKVNLHIDSHSAMTGVSLFQSLHLSRSLSSHSSLPTNQSSSSTSNLNQSTGSFGLSFLPSIFPSTSTSTSWTYSKLESLPISGPKASEAWSEQNFTHLLSSEENCLIFKLNKEVGSSPRSSDRQLFRPIRIDGKVLKPSLEFDGIARKSFGEIREDLRRLGRKLLRKRDGGSELWMELMPIEMVWRGSVWICESRQIES